VRGVARLVDQQERRGDRDRPDRNVDVEDPVPVDVLGDEPTGEGADRERKRRDSRPDADRRAALARRERDGDDRERRRVHERSADSLHDARCDEDVRAACEPAGKRSEREDDEADDEDEPAPEQVGELAAREHERAEGQRVARHDPFELGDLQMERALDRRQRDVHDRVVEHDHEKTERDGGERPPLAVLLGEDTCLHPHPQLASTKLVSTRLAT
jgi:hypothetical protein